MRRPFSPFGAAISFLAVTALVVGGLAAVTRAALREESSHLAAATRYERSTKERLALWRLDSQMLPALSLENNRPFAHYQALHATFTAVDGEHDVPAANAVRLPSPLLSADTPEWMLLHFQVDPETGWESPQVLTAEQFDRLQSPPLSLSVAGCTDARRDLLETLRTKFPAAELAETLAGRDRGVPDGSPFVVPFPQPDETSSPKPGPKLSNEPVSPKPPVTEAVATGEERPFGKPTPPQAPGTALAGSDSPPVLKVEPGPALPSVAGGSTKVAAAGVAPDPRQLASNAYANGINVLPSPDALLREQSQQKDQLRGDTELRLQLAERMWQSRGGYESLQSGNYKNAQNLAIDSKNEKQQAEVKEFAAKPGAGGKSQLPNDERKLPEDPAKKLDELDKAKQSDRRKEPFAGPGAAKGAPADADRKDLPGAPRAGDHLPRAPDRDAGPALRAFHKPAPAVHAVPVFVGPLRPHWLASADGTEVLVLVRAARLDDKTVYQGVVLDWTRLQASLSAQVSDLFPTATLTPVRTASDLVPERAMTALPAQLDPGPLPEPAAACWTPLRLGLLLAWVAALIALAGVGAGGGALLRLSERRIRFASAVSHELRSPLTSMRLYLDMLTSGMVTDERKQKEYLTTLAAESARLNQLVENVLDFAKLEKRCVRATLVPTPVADLNARVKDAWGERCAAEGRELIVASTAPSDAAVTTDIRMAAQVLGNLVDNARKYARDAADNRIWLTAKPTDGGRIAFEVEDRGPGVPARERHSIFRAFRRGQTAGDGHTGGAGLGLALAKQWAEMLGGRLTFSPPEGGIGARFRLELPASLKI